MKNACRFLNIYCKLLFFDWRDGMKKYLGIIYPMVKNSKEMQIKEHKSLGFCFLVLCEFILQFRPIEADFLDFGYLVAFDLSFSKHDVSVSEFLHSSHELVPLFRFFNVLDVGFLFHEDSFNLLFKIGFFLICWDILKLFEY